VASDLFKKNGGSISADGLVTLTAARTDIYGPITYGSINETLAGSSDYAAPEIEILSPLAGAILALDQPVEIRIKVRDVGVGVKQVTLNAFGKESSLALQVSDGVLTTTVSKPSPPFSMSVTAYDNKGHSKTATVSGLQAGGGNLTVAAGETYTLGDNLFLSYNSVITILGTLVVKEGVNPRLRGGSFNMPAGGEDHQGEDRRCYGKGPFTADLRYRRCRRRRDRGSQRQGRAERERQAEW
jgi:hypothetical protein